MATTKEGIAWNCSVCERDHARHTEKGQNWNLKENSVVICGWNVVEDACCSDGGRLVFFKIERL